MKIATFNVNDVKKRLANLSGWLRRARPDVARLSPPIAQLCAGSEFLAASLAKLPEKIDQLFVGSDKLAELGKTLVGFKISIKNFSSDLFSACYDSRRRKNAHSTDRCMKCNQGWDIARVMLKCVDIALGCILDEFFIQLPPTVYFLPHPLDADLPLVQQRRGNNRRQASSSRQP